MRVERLQKKINFELEKIGGGGNQTNEFEGENRLHKEILQNWMNHKNVKTTCGTGT